MLLGLVQGGKGRKEASKQARRQASKQGRKEGRRREGGMEDTLCPNESWSSRMQYNPCQMKGPN